MKKRILAFVMSMLLIVSAVLTLASCKGKNGNNGDKPKYETNWLDNLGDHDLGGYTVKFAVAEAYEDGTYGFNIRSIEAEENNGDNVDAAIYLRNEAIEDRFNCKIQLKYRNNNRLTTDLNTVFMGKGSDYDIIAGRQYDDVALCLNGVLVNLASDKTASKYLDLDREYWGTNYIKGMSYNGMTYWATGDLNLRYTGGFYGVFVNATLYNSKLKDTYGDIHDYVLDYNWTVDAMKEMSDKISNVSGAGSTNPGDSDVIGVAAPIHDNTNGWAVSCGVKFSSFTKNGKLSLDIKSKNETLSSYYEKYKSLLSSSGCVDYTDTDDAGGYMAAFEIFKTDRALFVPGRINQAELYLRTMQNDFYIIPNPQLNTDQHEYISSLHDAISIYGINKYSKNIEASAIVLEAMAAESYRTVRTVYYDQALKNKYTDSKETAKMIDLISAGAYSDFALVWSLTTYFNKMGTIFRDVLKNTNKSLTYEISSNTPSWKTGIQQLDTKFAELAAAEAA